MHLCFFDIYGVVYSDENKIFHPKILFDLEYGQNNGLNLVIFTNINYFNKNLQYLISKLNLQYLILYNGAMIYDVKNKQVLFKSVIKEELIKKILNYAVKEKCKYKTYKLDDILNLNTLKNNNILKIVFSSNSNNKLKKIANFIKTLSLEINFINNTLEVFNENVSKINSIKWFINYLKINIENTMIIGYKDIDIPLFKYINHSYAMDNASKKLKKIALHYAPSPDQNAMGMSIIDYLYRNKLEKNN